MEFRYRAGDERSRSSPPPPPATASSGSARALPANEDGHRAADWGTGDYHGGNSAVSPGQSSSRSAAAAGRDELRQAKKQKIMERILREEAEEWELESEVRREIMEQIFPLLRRSGNAQAPAAETTAAALLQSTQGAVTNANASAWAATLPAKRKNPAAAAAASAVSAARSSKKPKAADLNCAVCGITSTGEKAMQDHLNGKSHKKKAAALALSAPPPPEPEPELEEEDAAAMMPLASDGGGGSFSPTKLSMLTSAGVVYEVMQMDGYLLCEGCNVRTADRVTMMCHLDGGKHVSKATKLKQQQAGKPPAPASPRNGMKAAAAAGTTAAAAADGEHGTVVVEVDGEPHAVRRLDEVFILCDVCNVKAPSVTVMRSHLAGRKHKTMAAVTAKAKAEAAASMAAGKVGGNLEVQETGAMAVEEDVADTCPEKGTVDIVVGGEHHVIMRRTSCNVRATSESDMRLHLAGKKHKVKSMAEKAAMDMDQIVKATSKETAAAAAASFKGQAATPAVAPLSAAVDQPAKAAANGDVKAAAATGQQVKIQVEGRMFAVLRRPNGGLLCEPCSVRCSGKTDMVLHLYTREHWDKCGARPPT